LDTEAERPIEFSKNLGRNAQVGALLPIHLPARLTTAGSSFQALVDLDKSVPRVEEALVEVDESFSGSTTLSSGSLLTWLEPLSRDRGARP
jgi:hypothetical protein